jgi:hypothetical protein
LHCCAKILGIKTFLLIRGFPGCWLLKVQHAPFQRERQGYKIWVTYEQAVDEAITRIKEILAE